MCEACAARRGAARRGEARRDESGGGAGRDAGTRRIVLPTACVTGLTESRAWNCTSV